MSLHRQALFFAQCFSVSRTLKLIFFLLANSSKQSSFCPSFKIAFHNEQVYFHENFHDLLLPSVMLNSIGALKK